MRTKEINRNGKIHPVYYCDHCKKKFYKQMYQYVYSVKHTIHEQEKHFCCYQCRCDYLKAEQREKEEHANARTIRYI